LQPHGGSKQIRTHQPISPHPEPSPLSLVYEWDTKAAGTTQRKSKRGVAPLLSLFPLPLSGEGGHRGMGWFSANSPCAELIAPPQTDPMITAVK